MFNIFRTHNKNSVILWIDHSLGGGTETYSKAQFRKLEKKYQIMRLQFIRTTNAFQITDICRQRINFKSDNLNDIAVKCHDMNISEIVVNNLVGYDSSLEILQWVTKLKATHKNDPHVSFRLHDFQCICPSFNLIDNHGKFCHAGKNHNCEQCWKHNRLSLIDSADKILKSGARKICDWRQQWSCFLTNVTDSIIVFSNNSAQILQSVYPTIKNKIHVVPHTVKKYPRVHIKPHNDVNIVVLGNMSYQKGADVIRHMANELPRYQNTNIIIIGKMQDAPKNIQVYGRYKTKHLPNIIKKYRTDIIFIPSIWPETFSYTTSEAMSMGLPVACYDMGAPAERVKEYAHGLILKQISPSENLKQIIDFINNTKVNK